jgi:hypothetical protein
LLPSPEDAIERQDALGELVAKKIGPPFVDT